VDSRHPGLDSDLEAWRWLQAAADECGIVATKVDKLARGERIRAMRELESVHGQTVLPVSAVTGEGLDQLWKLIDRLANSPNQHRRRSSPPGALPRHPKNP
jgi:GTP-binding protein EngB required for normal cell division